jgi:hypothetical protein
MRGARAGASVSAMAAMVFESHLHEALSAAWFPSGSNPLRAFSEGAAVVILRREPLSRIAK